MPLRLAGRTVVLAGAETVPGTAESLTDVDAAARYVTSLEIDANRNMLAREGDSPGPRKWKSVPGRVSYPLNLTTELREISIADGNSNPPEYPFLVAAGFSRAADVAGDTKTLTFVAGAGTGSTTVQARDEDDGGAEYDKWTAAGVRGDWTIEMTADGVWTLNVAGFAQSLTVEEVGSAPARPTYAAAMAGAPVVGGAAYIKFATVGGDDYAGLDGCLLSATFTGNQNPVERNTLCGRQVDRRPRQGVTGSIVLERISLSGFNPYALRDAQTACVLMIASRDLSFTEETPGATGVAFYVWGTFVINSVAKGEENELKTWELELMEVHPEDTGDGGGVDTGETGFRLVYMDHTEA